MCCSLGFLAYSPALFANETPIQLQTQTTPAELKIIAGEEEGLYYTLAEDLEKLASQHGIDLDVIPSSGSLQNIDELYRFSSIPLAMSQLDVLAFMNTLGNDDAEIRQRYEALQLVLPLYQEKLHILAKKELQTISDLNGKKVAIGVSGSGTTLTSVMMLHSARVAPAELSSIDTLKAIDALRKGELDAVFYVAGDSNKFLMEEISSTDNIHLIPVTIRQVPNDLFFSKLYAPTTIPLGTYNWQDRPVETVAIQSALLTVSTRDNCTAVGKFAKVVYDNLDWLKQNGNSNWKNVEFNLPAILADKRLSPCVAQELQVESK